MAQFDAGINLEIRVNRALKALDRVERRMAALQRKSEVDVRINNLNKVNNQVKRTTSNLSKLGKALEGLENRTLSKLPQSLQTVVAFLKASTQAAKDLSFTLAGVGNRTEELTRDTRGYTREILSAAVALSRVADEQQRLDRAGQLASGRSGAFLQRALSNTTALRDQLAPGSEAYETASRRIIQLRSAINAQLRQQEAIESRILDFQIKQSEAVRKNVRASEAARQGSGFASFSQSATRITQSGVGFDPERSRETYQRVFDLSKDLIAATDELQERALDYQRTLTENRARATRDQFENELNAQDKLFQARINDDKKLQQDWDRRFEARERKKKQGAAADRNRERKRNRALQNIGLGAGFPLLFGGGIGSVIGGVAGSAGGFGGQIFASALGAKFDELGQAAERLGRALDAPIANLDELKNQAIFTSKAEERRIDTLLRLGRTEEAIAAIEQRLFNAIGNEGIRDLRSLSAASDDLFRALGELGLQAKAVVAGPLAALIKGISGFVQREATTVKEIRTAAKLEEEVEKQKGKAARKDLERERKRQFDAKIRENSIFNKGFGIFKPAKTTNTQDEISLTKRLFPDLDLFKEELPRTFEEITQQSIKTTQESLKYVNNFKRALALADEISGFSEKQQEKQQDLLDSRAKIVKAQEKQIAAIRLSLEEQVSTIRLANLRKANALLDAQADIRKQALSNELIGLDSGFDTTEASQAAAAVSQLLSAELSAEEQIAKLKRDTAIEVKALELQSEQLKIRVARQVADLNEASAERVADINKQIRKANAEQAKKDFDLDKRAVLLQLELLRLEQDTFVQNLAATGIFGTQLQQARDTLNAVVEAIERVRDVKSPELSPLTELTGVGSATVDTSAVERQLEASIQLTKNLAAAKDTLIELVRVGNYGTFIDRLNTIFNAPLNNLREDVDAFFEGIESGATISQTKVSALIQKTENELDELIARLEGFPQTPGRDIAIGQVKAAKGKISDNITETAQLELQRDLLTDLTNQRERLENATKNYNTVQRVTNELTAAGISLDSKKAKAILDQAREVDKLTAAEKQRQEVERLTKEISGTLVNGLVDGLQLAITETDRLGEAMRELASDILLAIGRALILSAIKSGINALAGDDTVGFFTMLSKGFAEGGFVTSPTSALVGEAGETEYVIPSSKMGEAMGRYSAGARGESVIPGKSGEGYAGGGSSGSTIVNYNGPTLSFNSEDYVPASAVPGIIDEAAKRGAKAGEQRTFTTLRNSRNQRSRIGI